MAGLRQAALVGGPMHRLANASSGELRNHARAFRSSQTRAMRHDASVDHQQFVGAAGFPPEHQIGHTWLSRAAAAMRYLLATLIRKLPQNVRELRPRQQVAKVSDAVRCVKQRALSLC